jgi:hypothetical protein
MRGKRIWGYNRAEYVPKNLIRGDNAVVIIAELPEK